MAPPPLPPPLRKRPSPWVWVLVNQLAFPGLGTIFMGRKVGYVQAVIMLAGFGLTMFYMLAVIAGCLRMLAHPNGAERDLGALYGRHLGSLAWGLGLCLLAWIWALISSLAWLREQRPSPA